MLKPYKPSSPSDGQRKRYFTSTFLNDGRSVTVTLEFDGGDANSLNNNCRLLRYWAGIYYGIISDKEDILTEHEIESIKQRFKQDWQSRHQMSVVHCLDNLFLPPDDSSQSEKWVFWIRVREEEGISEAIIGIDSIKSALIKLGFKEQ